MLRVLQREGLLEKAMAAAAERIDFALRNRVKDRLTVGAAMFSDEFGILCTTGPALRWLDERKEQDHA